MSSIIGVAQLNRYISLRLKNDVRLSGLTVRGEIADFKVHFKSGHAYFTLKEEGSQIRCVMFRGQLSRNSFKPEDGMKVLCAGNLEVYEPNGVYQLLVNEIVPLGVGERYLKIEAVKKKLEEKGYFAPERKKPLPPLPKRIAVVTSLNGAAVRDVITVLGRRYPLGEVIIFPAQVQGGTAPLSIAKALKEADSSGCDVIILTRGGGSNEDLMAFNTEEAATAAAECVTPLISAVGHETDTTLSDYAADVRAPTPSAAAEICVPDTEQLLSALDIMKKRLDYSVSAGIFSAEERLRRLSERLEKASPYDRLERGEERIEALVRRMRAACSALIQRRQAEVSAAGLRLGSAYKAAVRERAGSFEKLLTKLEALDPYSVLERGYTITMKDGVPVTSADALKTGDEIVICFRGGSVTAKITDTCGCEAGKE